MLAQTAKALVTFRLREADTSFWNQQPKARKRLLACRSGLVKPWFTEGLRPERIDRQPNEFNC